MSAEMFIAIITLIIYFGLIAWIRSSQDAHNKLEREKSKRDLLASALEQVQKSTGDNRLRNLARTALAKAQDDTP